MRWNRRWRGAPRSLSGGDAECRWGLPCSSASPARAPGALWTAGCSAAAPWRLSSPSPPYHHPGGNDKWANKQLHLRHAEVEELNSRPRTLPRSSLRHPTADCEYYHVMCTGSYCRYSLSERCSANKLLMSHRRRTHLEKHLHRLPFPQTLGHDDIIMPPHGKRQSRRK